MAEREGASPFAFRVSRASASGLSVPPAPLWLRSRLPVGVQQNPELFHQLPSLVCRQLRDQAYEYLRRIGLRESDATKYPDQLSGGMQQRVAIAQALMTSPRILLMDEAFSALDPGTRRGMQQLIRELWAATGTTILFVTHNTDEALRMGTRVVLLAKDAPDQ